MSIDIKRSGDLEEFYLDSIPPELRKIRKSIMDFTQIVPAGNIAAYSEYLARCAELLNIDKRISVLIWQEGEYDEYDYEEIRTIKEKVDTIIELQRKSK